MHCCYVVCIIYNRTLEHLKNRVLDVFQISLYFQEGIFSLKWDYRGHCVHCGGIKKLKNVKEWKHTIKYLIDKLKNID